MIAALKQLTCGDDLIASYVDGELDSRATLEFEQHLSQCEQCRSELQAHRMFICELDAALTQKDSLAVPADFSRRVAARAVSDMSGVRTGAEHRKALLFCALLALISFGLLGTSASQSGLLIAQNFVGKIWAVIGFVWSASYDAIASLIVIARVVSRRFVVEPRSVGLLLLFLAFAVFLLSRLISRYHRTGATD